MSLTIDVVIATRGRPGPLRDCLASINLQTVFPGQLIIIDSSDTPETRDLIDSLRAGGGLKYECVYRHSSVPSAAQQRNVGAELSAAAVILFLDDDVVLEPDFVAEILRAFELEADHNLGGVSGTISNQVYSDPRGLNRFLLGLCLGRFHGSFAGKVVGPAVNFLPADGPAPLQQVEWMPSTCTAYRRDVFLAHRFEDSFEGYSFAEDLHLSSRVAKQYRLVNTTRARLYHADLGKYTHRNWVAIGESQVVNRHIIMCSILGRNRWIDHLRFFAFEMFYTPLAWINAGLGSGRLSTLGALLRGKLIGFWRIVSAN